MTNRCYPHLAMGRGRSRLNAHHLRHNRAAVTLSQVWARSSRLRVAALPYPTARAIWSIDCSVVRRR